MLETKRLRDLLHVAGRSRQDRALLLLAVGADTPKKPAELKRLARGAGMPEVETWNVSNILARAKGLAIRLPEGWLLTSDGKREVAALTGLRAPRIQQVAQELHALAAALPEKATREFVDEAVSCFEAGNYRAAVVLSWVGAVSILHEAVIKSHLSAFNVEARRRNARWKNAKTTDDLGLMKESDFLAVLVSISVLGKNVKQELEGCLRLRNSCGHPTSLAVGENRVAAHLETLVLNVFKRF